MGIKHKKLMQWVGAGLLSESQADAIQAFENNKKSGRFGRGLVGLSVFAILIGVLLTITANWDDIPGNVKIGAHFLLNAGIGFAAWKSWKGGKSIWSEGYILGFFGLTLTLIALIGQVFQLDGETAKALLLWMIITLPFMLIFANGYMTVAPWMVAFLTTIVYGLGYFLDDWSDYWQGFTLTTICIFLPLAFMAKGSLAVCQNWKPVWADVFLKTGLVLTAIGATLAIIIMGFDRIESMPDDVKKEFWEVLNTQRLICLTAFGGIFLHAFFHKFYRDDEHMKLGAVFATVSLFVVSLPLIIVEFYNPVAAAIVFIAYWIFIGWLGQQLDQARLISLAIVIIAIRIFVIFVELFGSMMITGIGLVFGGITMLALIWGAGKMNKRLTKGARVA